MRLVNRLVTKMITRMSKEDKQRLINDITEKFLAVMTVEEKQKILTNVLEKFFAGMTTEDKKEIVSEITPHMVEGFDMAVIMPQMMMAMMGLGHQKEDTAGTTPMMVNITGKAKKPDKSKSSGQRTKESNQ